MQEQQQPRTINFETLTLEDAKAFIIQQEGNTRQIILQAQALEGQRNAALNEAAVAAAKATYYEQGFSELSKEVETLRTLIAAQQGSEEGQGEQSAAE